MALIRVTIEITTWKDVGIGAKHYYVDIREETTEERGLRFSNADFKYLPHAKKWAEMILSEYFDPRKYQFVWEDEWEYQMKDYKLKPPGRF